jgi:hypothetical protein
VNGANPNKRLSIHDQNNWLIHCLSAQLPRQLSCFGRYAGNQPGLGPKLHW